MINTAPQSLKKPKAMTVLCTRVKCRTFRITAMDSFKSKKLEKKFLVRRSKKTTTETPDKKIIISHWERRASCMVESSYRTLGPLAGHSRELAGSRNQSFFDSRASLHFKQVCACGIAFKRVAGIDFLQIIHK